MDRRDWLRHTTALAMGGTALGYAANETLNVGFLGFGGRAQRLLQAVRLIPAMKVVAVADVWDQRLAEARKLADPGAFLTKRYEEVLARKDVDAVIIASPDHWHVQMTVDACAAGKDIYVEKPLTHSLEEGARVVKAEKESKRIVQVGTQQRSMPHLIAAREIVQSGRLGEIHKVHMTWNRNVARARANSTDFDSSAVDWKRFIGPNSNAPFDPYQFRNWRWFWNYGGGIFTDLMVHWLDTVVWMLDLQPPSNATAIGGTYHAQGLWQTPDTVQCLLNWPDRGLQGYFEGTFVNARNGAMTEIMGSEATLYFDRGRYELFPERNKKIKAEEMILGTGPRGADFYDKPDGEFVHITNWFDCIRTRRRPATTAEDGVRSAAGAHLANVALRKNGCS